MRSNRPAAALCVVAGVLLGGCATQNGGQAVLASRVEPVMRTEGGIATAEQFYDAGRVALLAGDLVLARRHFSRALLADPNYVDAINGMAAILTVQGRYDDSLELIRQAILRDPDNAMYRRNLQRLEAMARRRETANSSGSPDDSADRPSLDSGNVAADAARRAPPMVLLDERGAGNPSADQSPSPAAIHGKAAVVLVAPNVFQLELPSATEQVATPASAIVAEARPARISTGSGTLRHTSRPPEPVRDSRRVGDSGPPAIDAHVPAMLAAKPADGAPVRVPAGSLSLVGYSPPRPAMPRLMVSNGMGRAGWARHHARLLQAEGLPPVRVTNYRHFRMDRTTLLYRPGMKAQAVRVAAGLTSLPAAVLQEHDALPTGVDVQLVLGHDSRVSAAGT